jgi:hypothetical protein
VNSKKQKESRIEIEFKAYKFLEHHHRLRKMMSPESEKKE